MSQKSDFFQLCDICFSHPFAFIPPCSSTVIFWTVQYLVLYHPTHVEFPTTPTWNSNRYLFISYQLVHTSYAIGTFAQFSAGQSFLLTTYFRLVVQCTFPYQSLYSEHVCTHPKIHQPLIKFLIHAKSLLITHLLPDCYHSIESHNL